METLHEVTLTFTEYVYYTRRSYDMYLHVDVHTIQIAVGSGHAGRREGRAVYTLFVEIECLAWFVCLDSSPHMCRVAGRRALRNFNSSSWLRLPL